MKKRVVIVGVVLGVVLVAVSIMALQSGLGVDTVTLEPQTVQDTITEKGVIETGTAVTQTAQVTGKVLEVCVQENQQVQAGDVLLRIDTTDLEQEKAVQQSVLQGYQAQLQQAQLGTAMTVAPAEYVAQLQEQIEVCQNNYETAERLYQNQQALYELGGISALELENSKTAWLQAKEQLTEAQQRYENSSKRLQALQSTGGSNIDEVFYDSIIQQAQSAVDSQQQLLQQLDLSLTRCTVTASIGGIVTQLPIKNATQVQAGQSVAVILSQQEALAAFEILTSEAPLLHVGDVVTLTYQLRSGDKILQGTIAQIYDFAQQSVSALGLEEHRVKVLVAIEDVQEILKDGYEIQGAFRLYQQDDVLAVPNSALFESEDQWYVFVVQNHTAVQTAVEIGYQAVTLTEIKAGLQAGDVIIQNANTEGLTDGVKVQGQ